MERHIACSYPGCTEPVIGQCPGYKKKKGCGRFYCGKHSNDGLCHVCSTKKACDEEAARLYDDYLAEAKRIGHLSKLAYTFWMVISILYIVVGPMMFVLIALGVNPPSSGDVIGVAVCFLLSIILVFYLPGKKRRIEYQVSKVNKIKPGFAEFHAKWTKDKASDTIALIGTISAVLFIGAAAGSMENDDEMRREIKEIRNEVRYR